MNCCADAVSVEREFQLRPSFFGQRGEEGAGAFIRGEHHPPSPGPGFHCQIWGGRLGHNSEIVCVEEGVAVR